MGGLYTYAPYCPQNFGGQVALPLLFSSEISGDKAYKLARPAAVEPWTSYVHDDDRLAARLVHPFHFYVLHGRRGWCGRLLALLHRFESLGYTTEDVLGFG